MDTPELREQVRELIPEKPKPAVFYTIPKLHKLPKLTKEKDPNHTGDLTNLSPKEIVELSKTLNITPPGRPIISGIGTLTEPLSGFIDSILNPYVNSIPSFVQDTTHFLRILSDIPPLPPSSLLVTLDVSALYSNIPHADGILACKEFLTKKGQPPNFVNDICRLIEFVLKHNDFSFNKKNFLQMKGTAMGTKMAPSFANIFMACLEEK